MVDDWKGLNKNSWLKYVFLFVAPNHGIWVRDVGFQKGDILWEVFGYTFVSRHRGITGMRRY